MGPLRNLRLPLHNPELKPSQVLTIERLGNPKNDQREETCTLIERAVSQPYEDTTLLNYRQSVMDIKVELATWTRFRDWHTLATYRPSTQRVAAAAKVLEAFYAAKNERPPGWVRVTLDQLPDGGVVVDEKDRQQRLNAVWESLDSAWFALFRHTDHWVEGWTGEQCPNPFWADYRPGRYWQSVGLQSRYTSDQEL